MTTTAPFQLILASTSRYRRELLQRLQVPFTCIAPHIDEQALPHEAPAATAQRLALAKAQAVAAQHPHAVVIGSDQVADVHGQPLGKPLTHARAVAQLQQQRGQTVLFHTAVAVVCQSRGFAQSAMATIRTRFRTAADGMDDAAIEAYLRLEQPYDCAGSFKCEGLGITLFDSLTGRDPNTLIGLPLIALLGMLRGHNVNPLL